MDKFLCGCNKAQKRNYRFEMSSNGTLTSTKYDKEGFEICPEHGQRLYGWRSPRKQGPQGNAIVDFSRFGSDKPLKLDFSSPDQRLFPNDDPEKLGQKVMAERRRKKNGKAK